MKFLPSSLIQQKKLGISSVPIAPYDSFIKMFITFDDK